MADNLGSILCNGDLCIQTNEINADSATIAAWAYTYAFGGHFELTTPDGQVFNSPTEVWAAGGANYGFNVPLFCNQQWYTITAWAGNGNPYTEIGKVSFTVNC
jgi:hypothetical protein